MPAKKSSAGTKEKKKTAPKGTNKAKKVVITIRKAETATLPEPSCVLCPDYWNIMPSAHLSSQCKIVQIPAYGSQAEKVKRLQRWYKNPRAFKSVPRKRKTSEAV